MNYLVQIKGFWIAQNAYSLGVEEVGLYFHLLEISNTLRWTNPFKRNNSKVMSDLGIRDRRTLDRYRNRLKQAGIIDFTTKNGDANVLYKLNDLSNFCTGFGIGDGIGSRIGDGTGSGTDNINKAKTKPNQTFEGKPSSPKSSSFEKNKGSKEKKGSAQKKESGTDHWPALVSTWFDFYRNNPGKGEEPTFEGQAPASLKKIVERLKKRSEAKKLEWNEQTACDTLAKFLNYAYGLTWLKDNFLLPNLERQYDKIVNQNAGTGTHKQGDGNISARSAFSKIDCMPD